MSANLINTIEINNPWTVGQTGQLNNVFPSPFSLLVGDLVVSLNGTADDATAGQLTTTGSLNGAYTIRANHAFTSNCSLSITSLVSTANGSETLTMVESVGASTPPGAAAFQFRAHNGTGNVAAVKAGQTTNVTCSANSSLLVICLDWNAVAGTRAWATINGNAPTSTGGVDGDAANWAAAWAYYADVGAAGSKTMTLSTPTFGKPLISAIEVLTGGPIITQQPTDVVVNNAANPGSFSVTATGATSYQWQDNRTGSFTNVSTGTGGTTATYTPAGPADYTQQGRLFRCQVTNASATTTSSSAELRVAYQLTGTGPRTSPFFGGPFGAGPFAQLQGSTFWAVSWARLVVPAAGNASPNVTAQPGAGSVSFAGLTPSLLTATLTAVPAGSGVFAGLAPIALRGTIFTPAQGSGAFVGGLPALVFGIISTPAPGAGAFVGVAGPTVVLGTVSTPAAGSGAFVGLAPTVVIGTIATPGVGSVAFVGEPVVNLQGRIATPATGSVSFSGQNVNGLAGIVSTPATGAGQFSGLAPTALVSSAGNTNFAPGVGAITSLGAAPTLFTQTFAQPGAGSAAFVGLAPTLVVGTIATPGVGSGLFAGQAPIALRGTIFTPGVGTIAASGAAPTSLVGTVATPGTGSITFAGLAPSIPSAGFLTPAQGTGSFVGLIPTIQVTSGNSFTAQPGVGTAAFNGLAPSLLIATITQVPSGSASFAGQTPILLVGAIAQPAAGAGVFAGLAPSLLSTTIAQAPTGTAAFAGLAPSLLLSQFLGVPTGAAAFVGLAPASVLGSLLQPASASGSFVGLQPSVVLGIVAQPGAGTVAFNGNPVGIDQGSIICRPDCGSITFQGADYSTPTAVAPPSAYYDDTVSGGYTVDRTYRKRAANDDVWAPPGSAAFTGFAPRVLVSDIRPVEQSIVPRPTIAAPKVLAHRVKLPAARPRVNTVIPIGCGTFAFVPIPVAVEQTFYDPELEDFLAMIAEFG